MAKDIKLVPDYAVSNNTNTEVPEVEEQEQESVNPTLSEDFYRMLKLLKMSNDRLIKMMDIKAPNFIIMKEHKILSERCKDIYDFLQENHLESEFD